MSSKLDHIGIFFEDFDAAVAFYSTILGQGDPAIVSVPELGLRLAFFTRQGGALIELVSATGKTELCHGDVVVALEVEDLSAEIARLNAAGIRCHHQKPTENLPLERGWISNGDGHGTIVELCPRGAVARLAMKGQAAS
jgi:catechol 2,3-dioxygenase-like lactoylglutathione lyase family enzyme